MPAPPTQQRNGTLPRLSKRMTAAVAAAAATARDSAAARDTSLNKHGHRVYRGNPAADWDSSRGQSVPRPPGA
eukprot:SAG22_NODE_12908_length_425_cov_0.920245_1_plen_72_part_01